MGDHTESLHLEYDPTVITLEELLDVFWDNHNPCYKSSRQYMSAIFAFSDKDLKLAEASKVAMEKKLGRKPTTVIARAGEFWVAEDYHQKYSLRGSAFKKSLTDSEILNTTLATKLNALASAELSKKEFLAQAERAGGDKENTDNGGSQDEGGAAEKEKKKDGDAGKDAGKDADTKAKAKKSQSKSKKDEGWWDASKESCDKVRALLV